MASELVATQLAAWFGLSVFDYAVIAVDEIDEIPFIDRDGNQTGMAQPGPAFITRAESGDTWSGDEKQLKRLVNPQDISRLVVFDTWLLNCDRFSFPTQNPPTKPRVNRNNVFLSEEAPDGQFVLKAMDHTHCFTCGREWTRNLSRIDIMKDTRLFGLFPEFRPFLDRNAVARAASDLANLDRGNAVGITQTIPNEWEVGQAAAEALVNLVVGRASFVAKSIERRVWPQLDLDLDELEHEEPKE